MEKSFHPYYKNQLQPSVDGYTSLKEDFYTNDTDDFWDAGKDLPGSLYAQLITPALIIQRPFEQSIYCALKRTVDIFVSAFIIIGILSWCIPLLAILIKSGSKGPVFFLQKRNKKNGKVFTCIKFRSMIVNDEADLIPARENDERITPIGRFLRKYYLDELPQFFNVIWGDMSLIGPRPHMISDNIKYHELIKNYSCRHKVKPGITGLAQVMGYVGSTGDVQKMQERVNMDILYARHWSLKLDMIILYRTITKAID